MTEFIEGITLESNRLAELPVQVQDLIFSKVSAQIQYLRCLPSEGYYGRVHGQGWLEPPRAIRTPEENLTVSGPYNSYAELTSVIHRAYEVETALWDDEPFDSNHESYVATFLSIFPDWNPHEPKFTWIDPALVNVIARPVKGDTGNEDWEVFLIDWESAGWYPAWVQSLQFNISFFAMINDLRQPPNKSGHYPLLPYRHEEILSQALKEFDPNPDWERLTVAQDRLWAFY
jgi:hypothetical protein